MKVTINLFVCCIQVYYKVVCDSNMLTMRQAGNADAFPAFGEYSVLISVCSVLCECLCGR